MLWHWAVGIIWSLRALRHRLPVHSSGLDRLQRLLESKLLLLLHQRLLLELLELLELLLPTLLSLTSQHDAFPPTHILVLFIRVVHKK